MSHQYLPSQFTVFSPDILKAVESDFWAFGNTPFCYFEISHRSPQYSEVNQTAQQLISWFLSVPQDYHVLFIPP